MDEKIAEFVKDIFSPEKEEGILHIPVKDIEEMIILDTGDNKYVYEDEDYMKEYYPVSYALQQLIKKYGV